MGKKSRLKQGALRSAGMGEAGTCTALLAGAGGLEGPSATRARKPCRWSVALQLHFCRRGNLEVWAIVGAGEREGGGGDAGKQRRPGGDWDWREVMGQK